MSEQLRIAQDIANLTKLDSLAFEKSIQKYLQTPGILLILADLLASDFQHSQKILAASVINRFIISNLDDNYTKWPVYWYQFYRDVVQHPQMDKIEWRHLQLLIRGTNYLFEDMAEDLCKTINPIFDSVNIKVKVLFYQSFARTETTNKTRYVFLRETIESYIQQIINFVFQSHQNHYKEKDRLLLQRSILANLVLILDNLEKYLSDTKITELLIKLSLNDTLFSLIIQELLYDSDKHDYTTIKLKQFTPYRIKELAIFSNAKDRDMESHLNQVKALTITIFTVLLRQYDKKSGLQEFDHHKHLNLMENVTPLVLQTLIELINKRQSREKYQQIMVSLLQYLTLTIKFNFLLQFYQTNFQKLLFKVCFPLLKADQIQIDEYKDNSDGFISIAEQVIELSQEEDQTKSIKNVVGRFLQKITTILDGSLVFVMESNISIIKYVLTGQIQKQLLQIIKKFDYEVSIETSLTILTLFSQIYDERKDLQQLLKHKLLDWQGIINVNNMDLARLFILLAYNFENIYMNCEEQGAKFLVLAARELQRQTAISQCALMLFENCIKLGFGQQIWDNLLLKLQKSKINTIFKIFRNIVQQKLSDLPFQYTKTLIARLIQRLIIEFQNAQEVNGIKKTTPIVSQIFNIMQEITQNKKYIENEPAVIDAIWPIFDLFEFVQTIQFEDDLLKVFNNVLIVSPFVDLKYFNFLGQMPHFHLKFQGFTDLLLKTFTNLLQKGRQHFINDKSQPSSLQNLVECLKLCYSSFKRQQSMLHFCIFMQYIFLQYAFLLKNDVDFFQILLRFYNQNKRTWQDETKAAVINVFIIAEYDFGGMDLNIIKQNSIEIFQGYQAKIFALGLRRLIQKYHASDIIIDYLCYSMRLLHFLRTIKQNEEKPRKSYYTPKFKGLNEIDPFQQICGQLDFIKRTLQPNRYDSIIQTLRSQISLGEIKDLISRRLIDNSLRKIYKVRLE